MPLSLTQLHLSIKSLFYSRQVSTYTYFELNTNIISYPLLSIHLDQNQIQSSKLKLISMGGGGSKSLAPPGGSIHSRERRLSHVDTNPPPQSEKLVECPSCSRSFASDRIDKHVEVRRIYITLAHCAIFRGKNPHEGKVLNIQNLPYFWNTKTHVVFFVFHFVLLYFFPMST